LWITRRSVNVIAFEVDASSYCSITCRRPASHGINDLELVRLARAGTERPATFSCRVHSRSSVRRWGRYEREIILAAGEMDLTIRERIGAGCRVRAPAVWVLRDGGLMAIELRSRVTCSSPDFHAKRQKNRGRALARPMEGGSGL